MIPGRYAYEHIAPSVVPVGGHVTSFAVRDERRLYLREGREVALLYYELMPEYLNQFLADKATMLVEENFTGVDAEWWWERRLGGGIAVCQELDAASVAREISQKTGHQEDEVRRVVEEELGLEDPEPVVLNFEIPGDTEASEAARMLAERSTTPEGLAANLYRRIEEVAHRKT
jgi:hypothetical protein